MAVRREHGRWRYRVTVKLPDGSRQRICGTPSIDTKDAARIAERQAIMRVLDPTLAAPARKEVPTFAEWHDGRYWKEWVIGRRNKPATLETKRSVFEVHLAKRFGARRLDEITGADVADFRADLVIAKLADKTVNDILGILSKPLRYAEAVGVIDRAPRVGMLKVERPEIVWWEIEHYRAFLAAAEHAGETWYAAACLAGEAGLRIGEVRALQWERDVDLVGRTLTVNEQRRKEVTGSPKGRTRRVVPMTDTLWTGLRRLSVIRRGYVIRNPDGSPLTDGQTCHEGERIGKRAGLATSGWHVARHTFGTHAALFGVNPWRLQAWLGHKRIDETMRYVHVAESHPRPIPASILASGAAETDPDRRILAMLSVRGRGEGVTKEKALPGNPM